MFLNGTCQALSQTTANCSLGCNSCIQNSANFSCVICFTGFMLLNGNCVPCPAGCSQCNPSNLGYCTSCVPGYFFNGATQSCSSCNIPNCYSCNTVGCTQCTTNYILSTTFTCQLACSSPCSSCSATDPTSCLSCIAGYTFNPQGSPICQPDFTCNSTGNCSLCPIGYSILPTDSGTFFCQQCQGGCARCNPNNPATCLNCLIGFFLNQNNCVACPSNCANCNSNSSCFTCALGFIALQPAYLASSSAPRTQGSVVFQPLNCQPCVAPCVTCQYTVTSCLSCQSGFNLFGATCLSNNSVKVSVNFSPANNDLSIFANNYYTIITGLADAVNITVNNIVVDGLIYTNPNTASLEISHASYSFHAQTTANIQLNLQVGTSSDSNEAQLTTDNINSYFSTLTISGLNVAYTNSTNPVAPPSSSNTNLIIAIVVPICVVRKFCII